MAAKKAVKKPAKASPKAAAPVKKATPSKPTTTKVSAIEKVLAQLPPLDERRRRVYRAAYSEEQCLAWGSRTKAKEVYAEAERFVATAHTVLLRTPVTTYGLHRLAWLAQVTASLADSIARDDNAAGVDDRARRSGMATIADRTRRRLAGGLMAAATGNAPVSKRITDRNEPSLTPHVLETTLTGLLQVAVELRRTDAGELLLDDAGITETFLSSVTATIDSLREANNATYGDSTGNDSQATNAVEGRVLREMAFLQTALRFAKDAGEVVGSLPPSRLLTQAANKAKKEEEEIPDPQATPTA